ncbi:sterile alpha motif domain-containing protein 14 [Chanos chanos]|uniref:Sterile alpha motif domain-containing protein 14 n=1 Tax=Chanos chanos TaxID=29144 RepID=A0A6J2VHX7_CHACN|nr:sterile alpha motif domain-containing protein 14-like [Chanos chanos]
MSSSPLAETEGDVFDLTAAVPETERLDTSLQKARAQLSVKARRQRPSRSRLRDSLSSFEGDESLDRKNSSSPLPSTYSPFHSSLHSSSPSSDLLLSSSPPRRERAFTFDTCQQKDNREAQGRRGYRHLLNTSSQEALLPMPSSSPSRTCAKSETSSPAHVPSGEQVRTHQVEHTNRQQTDYTQLHQEDNSHSEDDSHDIGPDEPGSPTVLLDKKSRRRFLDLGVTFRRTYGKVKKDRTNRLSAGNREGERAESRSSHSSGPPFVPFSWFSDRIRGSASSKSSSKEPGKSNSQGSGLDRESQSLQPYQSLSEYSDEGSNGSSVDPSLTTETRETSCDVENEQKAQRTQRLSGTHSKQDYEDGQKLLTT